MGTVPHPGCTWKDMFARGYQFVNAGSDIAKLRDSSLADVKEFRSQHEHSNAGCGGGSQLLAGACLPRHAIE